jgi:hypothetical protein
LLCDLHHTKMLKPCVILPYKDFLTLKPIYL